MSLTSGSPVFGLKLENAKTPWWIRCAVPLATWHMPRGSNKLYFTFDDGPTPGVTERVLDLLRGYAARATFFCQGEQVRRHPDLFQRILSEGHAIGNHGLSHVNGWQTPTKNYLADVASANAILQHECGFEPRLFRPPFGRLRWSTMLPLSRQYRIVMWDAMSMDYRTDLDSDRVVQNVLDATQAGSIVLWHDSELAAKHLWAVLPDVLKHFSQAGFTFEGLEDGRPYELVPQPA